MRSGRISGMAEPTRASGYYWVVLVRQGQPNPGLPAVIAKWDSKDEAWAICGSGEMWEESDTRVLAGPLAPPRA